MDNMISEDHIIPVASEIHPNSSSIYIDSVKTNTSLLKEALNFFCWFKLGFCPNEGEGSDPVSMVFEPQP